MTRSRWGVAPGRPADGWRAAEVGSVDSRWSRRAKKSALVWEDMCGAPGRTIEDVWGMVSERGPAVVARRDRLRGPPAGVGGDRTYARWWLMASATEATRSTRAVTTVALGAAARRPSSVDVGGEGLLEIGPPGRLARGAGGSGGRGGPAAPPAGAPPPAAAAGPPPAAGLRPLRVVRSRAAVVVGEDPHQRRDQQRCTSERRDQEDG